MLVTATPRGRKVGQVLQQFWKQVGANMEIEQVEQAAIVPRAFMRQFQLTPWRIIDLADPDAQMYANFRTGSPVALANYSNPELDQLLDRARTTADTGQADRDLLCDQPAHQQGGDLVLDVPEHLLRDLDGEDQGSAEDVLRGDRRLARLEGIAAHVVFVARRLLYLVPVLIAVSLLTFLIASLLPGDLAYVILGDQATPENDSRAAPRHGARPADLVALSLLARRRAAGRFRPILSNRADRAASGDGAVAGVAGTDAAGPDRRAHHRRSPGDRLRGAQRRASTAS